MQLLQEAAVSVQMSNKDSKQLSKRLKDPIEKSGILFARR